jgi:hypothetical protein
MSNSKNRYLELLEARKVILKQIEAVQNRRLLYGNPVSSKSPYDDLLILQNELKAIDSVITEIELAHPESASEQAP